MRRANTKPGKASDHERAREKAEKFSAAEERAGRNRVSVRGGGRASANGESGIPHSFVDAAVHRGVGAGDRSAGSWWNAERDSVADYDLLCGADFVRDNCCWWCGEIAVRSGACDERTARKASETSRGAAHKPNSYGYSGSGLANSSGNDRSHAIDFDRASIREDGCVPAGTKLHLVSRNGENVQIRYLDADYEIPISATDLK
jgi:hypothetical protein